MNKNEEIIKERLNNLEGLAFSSYKIDNVILPMPKWSSFNPTILKGSCIILSSFYDIQEKDGEIKIEYKPIPINIQKMKIMKKIKHGGAKDIVAKLKSNQIKMNFFIILWWIITMIVSVYIATKTGQYMYEKPIKQSWDLAVGRGNTLMATLNPKRSARFYRLMNDVLPKFIELSNDNDIQSNSTELAMVSSVYNSLVTSNIKLEGFLTEPLKYHHKGDLKDKQLTNLFQFLFGFVTVGANGLNKAFIEPFELQVGEFNSRLEELTSNKDEMIEMLKKLNHIINKDGQQMKKIGENNTEFVQVALGVVGEFFSFVAGNTEVSSVSKAKERLILANEIFSSTPAVLNEMNAIISPIPGDISQIFNHLNDIFSECIRMHTMSGVVMSVLQTVFYYTSEAVLKLVNYNDRSTVVMQSFNQLQYMQNEIANLVTQLLTQRLNPKQTQEIVNNIAIEFVRNIPDVDVDIYKIEAELVNLFNSAEMKQYITLISEQTYSISDNLHGNSNVAKAFNKIIMKSLTTMIKVVPGNELLSLAPGTGSLRRRLKGGGLKRHRSKKVRKQRKSKKTRKNTR